MTRYSSVIWVMSSHSPGTAARRGAATDGQAEQALGRILNAAADSFLGTRQRHPLRSYCKPGAGKVSLKDPEPAGTRNWLWPAAGPCGETNKTTVAILETNNDVTEHKRREQGVESLNLGHAKRSTGWNPSIRSSRPFNSFRLA